MGKKNVSADERVFFFNVKFS